MDEKDFTREALELALKQGSRAVRIVYGKNIQHSISVRNDFLEKMQYSSDISLFFYLYCEGRYGSCSTNRMDRDEIAELLGNTLDTIRNLAPDPARRLPPKAWCYQGGGPSLEQYDPFWEKMETRQRQDHAFEAAAEVMGKDPRILSVCTRYSDALSYIYMIDSQGFEAESKQSSFGLSAECAAQGEGDARPSESRYEGDLFYERVPFKGCARKAMQYCLEKIPVRKLDSGNYNLLVHRRAADILLSPLLTALSGSNLQQKRSFLEGKKGRSVASPLFSLRDEPHSVGQNGARYFDSEGLATKPLTLFQDGILQNYYISYYDSLKLNTVPTADAPSLLVMPAGSGDCASLMRQADKGILVTDFNGGNCNEVTGDFSYGIEGFYFEKGRKVFPVHEMLISGNMLQLWKQLAATGSDARENTPLRLPSLLFENIAFSGF